MLNTFSILFSPRETYMRIDSKPNWLGTFLILAILSIVMYALMHPFLVRAALAHLPSSAAPADKEVVAQTLRSELPVRCAFLPIRLLIGWSTFAFVLFAICKAFTPSEPVHFIKIFSLEVHAELINIVAQSATLINLFIMKDASPNATALVPFSAAAFVGSKDIVTFSLLNSLNFFTLLYMAILTMGVSTQSGFSRVKSLLIVVLTWSAYLLFNVGTIKLMRDTMHLLI